MARDGQEAGLLMWEIALQTPHKRPCLSESWLMLSVLHCVSYPATQEKGAMHSWASGQGLDFSFSGTYPVNHSRITHSLCLDKVALKNGVAFTRLEMVQNFQCATLGRWLHILCWEVLLPWGVFTGCIPYQANIIWWRAKLWVAITVEGWARLWLYQSLTLSYLPQGSPLSQTFMVFWQDQNPKGGADGILFGTSQGWLLLLPPFVSAQCSPECGGDGFWER